MEIYLYIVWLVLFCIVEVFSSNCGIIMYNGPNGAVPMNISALTSPTFYTINDAWDRNINYFFNLCAPPLYNNSRCPTNNTITTFQVTTSTQNCSSLSNLPVSNAYYRSATVFIESFETTTKHPRCANVKMKFIAQVKCNLQKPITEVTGGVDQTGLCEYTVYMESAYACVECNKYSCARGACIGDRCSCEYGYTGTRCDMCLSSGTFPHCNIITRDTNHTYVLLDLPVVNYSTALSISSNPPYNVPDGYRGYLATITSSEEQSFITSKFATQNFWVSGRSVNDYWTLSSSPEQGTAFYMGKTKECITYCNFTTNNNQTNTGALQIQAGNWTRVASNQLALFLLEISEIPQITLGPITFGNNGHIYTFVNMTTDWLNASEFAGSQWIGRKKGHIATLQTVEEHNFYFKYFGWVPTFLGASTSVTGKPNYATWTWVASNANFTQNETYCSSFCVISSPVPKTGRYFLSANVDRWSIVSTADTLPFVIEYECVPESCYYHGVCNHTDSTCICEPNYTNENCSACATGFFRYPDCLACGPKLCHFQGECYGSSCFCNDSFTGLYCEKCKYGGTYPFCIRKDLSTGHAYELINSFQTLSLSHIYSVDHRYDNNVGYLATVESHNESLFIRRNFPDFSFWIAGSCSPMDDSWALDTGPNIGKIFYDGNTSVVGEYEAFSSISPPLSCQSSGILFNASKKLTSWEVTPDSLQYPYLVEFSSLDTNTSNIRIITDYTTGHTYEYISNRMTWAQARYYAANIALSDNKKFAHLVEVGSAVEHNFLMTHFHVQAYFIGGYTSSGAWVWDGAKVLTNLSNITTTNNSCEGFCRFDILPETGDQRYLAYVNGFWEVLSTASLPFIIEIEDLAGPIPCACPKGSACCEFCNFRPNTYVCRDSTGVCDAEETCDGVRPDCPPDLSKPYDQVCFEPPVPSCEVPTVCGIGLMLGNVDCDQDTTIPSDICCLSPHKCETMIYVCGDGKCERNETSENCLQDCVRDQVACSPSLCNDRGTCLDNVCVNCTDGWTGEFCEKETQPVLFTTRIVEASILYIYFAQPNGTYQIFGFAITNLQEIDPMGNIVKERGNFALQPDSERQTDGYTWYSARFSNTGMIRVRANHAANLSSAVQFAVQVLNWDFTDPANKLQVVVLMNTDTMAQPCGREQINVDPTTLRYLYYYTLEHGVFARFPARSLSDTRPAYLTVGVNKNTLTYTLDHFWSIAEFSSEFTFTNGEEGCYEIPLATYVLAIIGICITILGMIALVVHFNTRKSSENIEITRLLVDALDRVASKNTPKRRPVVV